MVEPDRVRSKLGKLEEYLRGLEAKQDCSLDEYQRDADRRDIVERRFQKATQACIDIASHVVSTDGFREPENYGDLFVILGEESVLTGEVAEQMVEMAGFRNVLAHEYANIVDERVHRHLQNLERFRRFAEEIQAFLDGESRA